MTRTIIAATLAALFTAGLASAETLTDNHWFSVDGAWRKTVWEMSCTNGPWVAQTRADGSRYMARSKQCKGAEVYDLGKLPE